MKHTASLSAILGCNSKVSAQIKPWVMHACLKRRESLYTQEVAFLTLCWVVQQGDTVSLLMSYWTKWLWLVTLRGEHYSARASSNGVLYFVFEIFKLVYKKIPLFWRCLKIRYLSGSYRSVLDVSSLLHGFDQSSWWHSVFSFIFDHCTVFFAIRI